MKNLFDFANENFQSSNTNIYNQNDSQGFSNSNFNKSPNTNKNSSKEEIEKDAKELYDKYKDYSENELLNEFLSTSKAKMQDGSLTKEKIQNTVNSLAPFLNSSQKEYLKDLIGKLDD